MVNKETLFEAVRQRENQVHDLLVKEEDWLIYGVDKHDWAVFVYREQEMPDPVKFALDIMEDRYTYDEDTDEWYDRAGDPLSDSISWYQNKQGWTIECHYDGTMEGMTIECTPLMKVSNYLWHD